MVTVRADAAVPDAGSPAAGIAFMCAGVFCLTVNDAFAKALGPFYPVPEIVFFRMLLALPLIVGVGLAAGGTTAFATQRLRAHLVRGVLATCASFAFFLSLTLLPLAEVTAITFTAPLFVTVLAIPLLGERPGRRRWIIVGIGFLGVLLIVRPGGVAFGPSALVPLGAAVSYGLLMLTARRLGRGETIWANMFYATIVPTALAALVLPWAWRTPSLEHVPWFIACGFFGGLAITLITQGYRIGVATIVAPFDYTGLVWATLFGWMFWGEVPSALSAAGGIVIAACGIYLAWSETRNGSRRRAALSARPPRCE